MYRSEGDNLNFPICTIADHHVSLFKIWVGWQSQVSSGTIGARRRAETVLTQMVVGKGTRVPVRVSLLTLWPDRAVGEFLVNKNPKTLNSE